VSRDGGSPFFGSWGFPKFLKTQKFKFPGWAWKALGNPLITIFLGIWNPSSQFIPGLLNSLI